MFQHNYRKLAALGLLALIPAIVRADNNSSADQQKPGKPEPRYMMGTQIDTGTVERKLGPNDFTWFALTNNGAANGSDPIVGFGSGKAYFDFKDGLPHPYYIAPKK